MSCCPHLARPYDMLVTSSRRVVHSIAEKHTGFMPLRTVAASIMILYVASGIFVVMTIVQIVLHLEDRMLTQSVLDP